MNARKEASIFSGVRHGALWSAVYNIPSSSVSRASRSVPNRDTVLFYDSIISFRRFVISFRRFVIPWFTDCLFLELQTSFISSNIL